ncbi:MAG: N-acetylmuramic acid 6-phosphate etherase, partial [Bacteroidota bacterium]
STRMKSGTSQKLILNMISTAYMIRIGRVEGHKMVHMQLTNEKLVGRGTSYIEQALGIETEEALRLLKTYGSVARAVEAYRSKT